MQANLSVFETLQNIAHRAMVFNTPENIAQIRQAANIYHKILNDAIKKANQLVKVKGEYEIAQTEWAAAKSRYESGKQVYDGICQTVRQNRHIQAENALEAKQKGDLNLFETYRVEDNTIRDIITSVFAKDRKLNAIIDEMIASFIE
jgi:cytochrome c5